MKVMKEVKNRPELSPVIAERRYVWRFFGSYMKAKQENMLSQFWTRQMTSLNDFNQYFPNHHRSGPPPPGRLLLTQEPAQVMKATGSFHRPTMPERSDSPPLPYVNIFATTPETGTTGSALLPNAGPFKSAFPQHMPAAGSSQVPLVVNAGPSQESGNMPDAGSSLSAAGSSQAPINVDAGSSTTTPGAGDKSLIPDPDAEFVPDAEGGDEDADGSDEEGMVPEKDKKKGKKRADPVPSGIFRIPMCLRCASARDQICEEQTGGSTACYRCAKWKMKCDAPPKKDGPGPASNQPPPATQVEAPAPKAPKTIAKKPAAKAKPAVKKTAAKKPAEKVKPAEKSIKSKPAKVPAPKTLTSKPAQEQAPAPTPSTSKPVPVPAPNPSTSKKRKVIKSPETVNSERSEDEDEMDWSHWPEHRRTFLEFETYYGSVLFFIFIAILIHISRYSSVQE